MAFDGDRIRSHGDFYYYIEFSANFQIRSRFLDYNGLLASVKNTLIQKHGKILKKGNFVHLPLSLVTMNIDKTGCKAKYNQLL